MLDNDVYNTFKTHFFLKYWFAVVEWNGFEEVCPKNWFEHKRYLFLRYVALICIDILISRKL